MLAAQVAQVRRFNRTVTQRAGALSDSFLASHRPLAEARVLWEVGRDGCEVRALRDRLELDSGHLSRLLRALKADGLVEMSESRSDRRVRVARLTAKGLAERAVLDERSDELAASILTPLDRESREELLDAMRTVERLITSAAVEIRTVDPTHPDARRCLRSYFDELNRRSESGYDPSAGVSAEPHELRPPAGGMLVAYLHGEAIGCGAVKHHPGEPTEIKRMWISPSVRGLGLGRRMLAELEALAAASGAPAAHIETSSDLVEAVALYRSVGYREVAPFNDEPFADHWFEKRL